MRPGLWKSSIALQRAVLYLEIYTELVDRGYSHSQISGRNNSLPVSVSTRGLGLGTAAAFVLAKHGINDAWGSGVTQIIGDGSFTLLMSQSRDGIPRLLVIFQNRTACLSKPSHVEYYFLHGVPFRPSRYSIETLLFSRMLETDRDKLRSTDTHKSFCCGKSKVAVQSRLEQTTSITSHLSN